MINFRVFVSSPGDVAEERSRVHEILAILPQEPAWRGKISIDTVRWDSPYSPTPMYANLTPQEAVNRNLPKPSECDLVVMILWARFGTPLTEPLRPDGSRYKSGTEWECEDAINAKVPVLLYRRMSDPTVSLRDPEYSEKKRQLDLVDTFFRLLSEPGGAATGGYIQYDDLTDFNNKFRRIIEGTLRQLLEARANVASQDFNSDVTSTSLTSSMMTIVDRLTRQLEERDREIASLKTLVRLRNSALEPSALAEHPSKGTQIEVTHLDSTDVRALPPDPSVIAVAPIIPMKLIAPFADAQMPSEMPSTTWGVTAVRADASPFTGNGVVVAVVDTGINSTHPAFAGLEIHEHDFSGEGNGDRDGHGTHFAGIVFGRSIGGVCVGVAPGIRRALIAKAIGSRGGSSEAVLLALQWAMENGADVIALSSRFDSVTLKRQLSEQSSAEIAELNSWYALRSNARLFDSLFTLISLRACLIVAAAGNESQRGVDPNAVAHIGSPADTDNVISVAALSRGAGGLTISPFSNRGAFLAAPGERILSARLGGGLISLSGTSMAAAHVAGVAALWWESLRGSVANPATQVVKAKLLATARTAALAPGVAVADMGAGLVTAPT